MALEVPKLSTISAQKKRDFNEFKKQIPKDAVIKFHDTNKNGVINPTEWIEYEQNGQRIVGYSPYGNKQSVETVEKVANRLGVPTNVIKKQVGDKINPNSFLRLTLPKQKGVNKEAATKALAKASSSKASEPKKTVQETPISDSRKALIDKMNKDTTFNKLIEHIFEFEGKYSNAKGDKGKKTNMGITEKVYNNYCDKNGIPKGEIKNLSKEMAKEIYYSEYWKLSGANNIKNEKLALLHFDTAINMGISTAKNLRQQSGDDINKYYDLRQKKYDKLVKIGENYRFKAGWNNRMAKLKTKII